MSTNTKLSAFVVVAALLVWYQYSGTNDISEHTAKPCPSKCDTVSPSRPIPILDQYEVIISQLLTCNPLNGDAVRTFYICSGYQLVDLITTDPALKSENIRLMAMAMDSLTCKVDIFNESSAQQWISSGYDGKGRSLTAMMALERRFPGSWRMLDCVDQSLTTREHIFPLNRK